MTQDQALAIARERYGAKAYAEKGGSGQLDIGTIFSLPGWDPRKFGPLKFILGWGDTWEDALELAEKRRQWHTGETTNDNPSEHAPEAGENFTQMRLFP